MLLPHNTLVAVADGEKLHLFRTEGNEEHPRLTPAGHPQVGGSNHSGGSRHHSSAANPDEKQGGEDTFAAAVAKLLNEQAQGNVFEPAVIIAAPQMLGELRKHYHKALSAKLMGEIAKDMTGQMAEQIAKAIEHA